MSYLFEEPDTYRIGSPSLGGNFLDVSGMIVPETITPQEPVRKSKPKAKTISREPMRKEELGELFDKNLDRIDTNKDKAISKTEINRAFQDPNIRGKDAQFVAIAEALHPQLANLSFKFPWDGNKITKEDIAVYERMRNRNNISFEKLGCVFSGKIVDVFQIDESINSNSNRLVTANPNLYANMQNPLESIKPEFVKQTSLTNCYFHAPLAAVAKYKPEVILQSIQPQDDGSFMVHFRGEKTPYHVPPLTEAEIIAYAGASQGGTWPGVMEKAYGQYLKRHATELGLFGAFVKNFTGPVQMVKQYFGSPSNTDCLQQEANGGGLPFEPLTLLTGDKVATDNISFITGIGPIDWLVGLAPDRKNKLYTELDRRLTELRQKNLPAVLGTNGHVSTPGLISNHAYSVLDYDPQGKLVKLRNPWGKIEPYSNSKATLDEMLSNLDRKTGYLNDGIFWYPLKDAPKDFQDLEYDTSSQRNKDDQELVDLALTVHNFRKDLARTFA